MRYISVLILFSFSVTSGYAAVGLETTPIRSLADDLEVGGADEWWVRHMVAKAERDDNLAEIKVSAADGYHAGVASGEIDNDTRAEFRRFRLLGIAGTSSKASKEVRSIAAQTEGQKYVYNSTEGDSAENVKQKRSNKGKVFIIGVAVLGVLSVLIFHLATTPLCAPC